MFDAGRFVEVHVGASPEACEALDTKRPDARPCQKAYA